MGGLTFDRIHHNRCTLQIHVFSMGGVLSLEHEICESDVPSKAIMVMVYEKKSLTPVSFVDFVTAPASFAGNPVILYEPFDGVGPVCTGEVSEKLSYKATSRTLHQIFKITPYQFKTYRLVIFASPTISQSVMKEVLEFSRHFNFQDFQSLNGIDPSELFYDLGDITSLVHALRPQNTMRISAPVKQFSQLPHSGTSLQRRSQQPVLLPTTFMPTTDDLTHNTLKASNDCDMVVDRLYIGTETAARNGSLMASLGITHIVNLSEDDKFAEFRGFEYYTVKMSDSVFEDLTDDFWKGVDIIADAINSGGCVLVHCRRGISRSAAMCVAYLMQARKLSFDSAFSLLKQQRPAVNINPGFVEQLKAKEASLRAKGQFRGKSLLLNLVLK